MYEKRSKRKARIVIWIMLVGIIATGLIDVVGYIIPNKIECLILKVFGISKFLRNQFGDTESDCVSSYIASLLVVWTFINAVIMFYMEKKDNKYQGVRQWDLVFYGLEKEWKVICRILFMGLFVILLNHFVLLPLMLICSSLVLFIMAIGVFRFAFMATDEKILEKCLKASIEEEYRKNTVEKSSIMKSFFYHMKEAREAEFDLLIDILINQIFLHREYDCRSVEEGKKAYGTMRYIYDRIEKNKLGKIFAPNLAKKIIERVKEENKAIDILTVLVLPLIEMIKYETWDKTVKIIEKETIRRKLRIRSAGFAKYLSLEGLSDKIQGEMDEKDQEEIVVFWQMLENISCDKWLG